ncbi:hypothetical protein EDC56_3082 [Sinobacterium caligoides]|uniref:Probable membrane transporter protein n=1 Tax=Sinobacterium caligoides TaxID=933926 RepID=A0A3N2DGD4_9GAMM|nr:sulfite exporter TauE/SafE family protein [Sinobacterium caligoides]ROR98847.1 hypothetical protein EDC56_3082 [Sinobacterium caligoides]
MVILVYLLIGAVAGLVAGLFGVGGGLIIVPVLVLAFSLQGMPADVLTHLAIGTSLATIIITSMSSVRTHHAKGAVDWPVFWRMAPGILLGAWLGAATAELLSGRFLQLAIGCFAVFVALQMSLSLRPRPARQLPAAPGLFVAGGLIGWVSAIFGIGGGSLSVPFYSWCNVQMQRAVATSSACGLPIAIAGAAGSIQQGWANPDLPAWSSGYVYWPAFVGIILTSTIFAKYGALLAHKLPPEKLKKVFALFLLLIGLQFIIRNL